MKLLAAIRENRARVEKAARGDRAVPPPASPTLFTGTVTTPDTPNPPSNYIAQALSECTTTAQCEELLEHARAQGYDDGGQTVQLIRAKLEDLGARSRGKKATKRTRRTR